MNALDKREMVQRIIREKIEEERREQEQAAKEWVNNYIAARINRNYYETRLTEQENADAQRQN